MSSIYIDESGVSDLLSPRYRFFLMTGVVIEDTESIFAQKLLEKWKKKHSISLNLGFHAYDLFESNENNSVQLRTNRTFNIAIQQLIDIINTIDFKAYCSVVDLKLLRKSLDIKEPPNKKLFTSKRKYKEVRKLYIKNFLKLHGVKKRNLPIELSLGYLLKVYKQNISKNNYRNGKYINFESLGASDSKIIRIFHELQVGGESTTLYGKDIQGINFHTKSSLTFGIEIADIISYSTTQSWRSKFKLKNELTSIPERSLFAVRKIKKEINKFTDFNQCP